MEIELLKKAMKRQGLSKINLARLAKISFAGLCLRIWGFGEFTLEEICRLSRVLKLTERDVEQIFFAKKVS